ncbi:MAG: ATP phosphoribosyltransferase regulatory subunit, partial [Gemmatimonadota bacterium]
PGPLADAELIALAIDMMRDFDLGASDVRVRLSDRRILMSLLAATGVPGEWRALQLAAIDRLEKNGREKTAKWILEEKAAALTDEQIQRTLAIGEIRSLPAVAAACANLPDASLGLESLRSVLSALESMGLAEFADIDLGIVRGLAYYTGTVFELFDAGRTLRAIAGGGRYDGLLQQLGGVDLPAVGFAIGDVVLGELLKERGLLPPEQSSIDVFLAAIGQEDHPELLRLAHELRDAGIRVEFSLAPGAVGKQLKLADARQAAFAVVIGPDDRARGEVQLKDLKAKTQTPVPLASLKEELIARLRQPMANG